MQFKLNFELVPEGCWNSNLRTILSKKQWDYIKQLAKQNANHQCAICGKKSSRLEAHERWVYDIESSTQKLVGIIAVCKDCHSVIHIGRTQLVGNIERAEKHYMMVNNCTYSDFRRELGKANELHQLLNRVEEWKLDISSLKEFLNLY